MIARSLSIGALSLSLLACDGASQQTPAGTPTATSSGSPSEAASASDAASERAGAGASSPAPPQIAAPPFRMSDRAIEAKSADGTYVVRWEPVGGTIPDAEPFEIRFALRRADGAAIGADARFLVDAEMPQHGHGMNLIAGTQRVAGLVEGETQVLASNILLHMPGRWVLAMDIGEGGIFERVQWFIDVD